jgi:hypothetical protein
MRSARAQAAGAVRALQRAGRDDPGGRFEALLGAEAASVAHPRVEALGPRFSVRTVLGDAAPTPDIRRL